MFMLLLMILPIVMLVVTRILVSTIHHSFSCLYDHILNQTHGFPTQDVSYNLKNSFHSDLSPTGQDNKKRLTIWTLINHHNGATGFKYLHLLPSVGSVIIPFPYSILLYITFSINMCLKSRGHHSLFSPYFQCLSSNVIYSFVTISIPTHCPQAMALFNHKFSWCM